MKILSVLNRLEPYIDTLEENKLKINSHNQTQESLTQVPL
jgi:hypothetical protein